MDASDPVLEPGLSVADANKLLTRLEKHPGLVGTYWLTLEQMIASCMDLTFKATDPQEKVRLATLEYRARMLRKSIEHPQN